MIQKRHNAISSDENAIFDVFIENEMDNIKLTALTEVGSTITYLPLETISKSLLKGIKKIVITDSSIFVSDVDNVMRFDLHGKFICKYGNRGRGPGEYQIIYDFAPAMDYEKLLILTSSQICLEYTADGRFVRSAKLESISHQILPLNKNTFVFYCYNMPKYMHPCECSLIITDADFNTIRAYKNHHKRIMNPGISINKAPLYSFKGKKKYKEFGCDTLYTITEKELIPYAVFNLGRKKMPADLHIPESIDKTIETHAGKYFVRWITEDIANLYFTMYNLRDHLYGYFEKNINAVRIIGDQGFQNNIDGGLPFFPKYVYDDNTLADYVDAFELREHVLRGNVEEMRRKYGKNYDDLLKLANSLDDESNPIMVLVKK